MNMERERRAAAITDADLENVIEQLERGCSLDSACTRAQVNVSDLRWLRYGNYAISRRVDAARRHGLRRRAGWLRERAARLNEGARKLEDRAAKL